MLTFAIAGNPNSGKTTFFNKLTGATQHVGNYPGVTVEKKTATVNFLDKKITLVDLPGTYSLAAHSEDEIVARDFIIKERPDLVINVADANNLERNLFLATQLIELKIPLVIALNMIDIAEKRGINLDLEKLSSLFGCPVIATVASNGRGVEETMAKAVELLDGEDRINNRVRYGRDLEEEIGLVLRALEKNQDKLTDLPLRWLAVKLIEDDQQAQEILSNRLGQWPDVEQAVKDAQRHLKNTYHEDISTVLANARYGFIVGALKETVTISKEQKIEQSEKIDNVLTHRLFGLPIFFFFMWLIFKATFVLGEVPMDWIESFFAFLSNGVEQILPAGFWQSLISDGIIAGVGGVLVFLPNIMILFLGIAILEDSGYMARTAFLMDRLMHKVGLHGKSFIPLLIGFGCNVPALMATRTLENKRDRFVTMSAIPFMSCSARLPVYILLAGAFFSSSVSGNLLFAIYLFGIAIAALTAMLLSRFGFKDQDTPFVMELPAYHLPTIKGLFIHMWRRAWLYIKKAGTIILFISILFWFLSSFPKPAAEKVAAIEADTNSQLTVSSYALQNSFAGRLGKFIEPLIKPLGFDWKIGVSLIAGFAAKEVVVSTMGTVYSIGDEVNEESVSLRKALRADPTFSPLVAISLMIFILLYVPCMSTIVVLRKETGSVLFAYFIGFYTTAVAWCCSFVVYQGGRFLGF